LRTEGERAHWETPITKSHDPKEILATQIVKKVQRCLISRSVDLFYWFSPPSTEFAISGCCVQSPERERKSVRRRIGKKFKALIIKVVERFVFALDTARPGRGIFTHGIFIHGIFIRSIHSRNIHSFHSFREYSFAPFIHGIFIRSIHSLNIHSFHSFTEYSFVPFIHAIFIR